VAHPSNAIAVGSAIFVHFISFVLSLLSTVSSFLIH
jgi:hypothetical protein